MSASVKQVRSSGKPSSEVGQDPKQARPAAKMSRREAGRLGGKALTAKVAPAYMAFIGRRGGRRTKRNELLNFATSLAQKEPEKAEIWFERARRYNDETGSRVMLELWLKGNCEPRPARCQANTDFARLRRWQKING